MSFTPPPSFQTPDGPPTPHAREWGLSSLILAILLPFAVPAGALVAVGGFAAFAMLGGRLSREDQRGLLDVLTLLPFILAPIPAFGLWFGIRGLQWAERTHAPGAFATAGIVINSVLILVLLVALITTLIIRFNVLR